ncbi:Protease-associated domain-containing protein 1 [Fasciola gigantica]|uniref:Protease-associated domain-containing protein 1 n=1 Tax=Fasciola gigantica TaxID=46835 RepID=A0A504YQP0_FASGI|nr:Protease-associated domain-containing protein 1 [Fasciola gigantica]
MRVVDPPGLPNLMKLSLAQIGPRFNLTNPTYLSHFNPENACSQSNELPFEGTVNIQLLAQTIALIARGGCSFVTKVINAHIAGSAAAVIYDLNPRATQTFSMIQDETNRRVLIPCAFMNGKDG